MNKKFKKLVSGLLACTIMTTTSVPAMAAFAEAAPDSSVTMADDAYYVDADKIGTPVPKLSGSYAQIERNIVDITGDTSEEKVRIDVIWDDMTFVYDFGTVVKYEWDSSKLKYIDKEYSYKFGNGPGWNKTSATVTFINRSNRPVEANVNFVTNFAADQYYEGVDVLPTKTAIKLKSAVGKNHIPQTDAIDINVEGTPDESIIELEEKNQSAPDLGNVCLEIWSHPDMYEDYVHEHYWVYDQFGRLTCRGCGETKHEYCWDYNEDGRCDECGLERDFCEDCHIGGTCRCT